jgi:hypothetical protein
VDGAQRSAGNRSGPVVPTCVIARSRELILLDDWYATGMTATGSNTVIAENVFVPAHRTLQLPDMLEARYPARHNADNPYFNYPLAPVLAVNAGGTPVGIARGALEVFLERLPGRSLAYTNYTNKWEAPITHLQLGEAVMKIESANAHVRRAALLLDEHPREKMSIEARVKSRVHISISEQYAALEEVKWETSDPSQGGTGSESSIAADNSNGSGVYASRFRARLRRFPTASRRSLPQSVCSPCSRTITTATATSLYGFLPAMAYRPR